MSSSSAGVTHDAIVSSLVEEVPGLTEEEKIKLDAVLKKAKEFDAEEENKMRKPVEGQLYKYTNVVKGWQYRWFVLTPETGMLEYYMMDEIKKHRPRGGLHLAGAVISPSQEDNQSFSVNAMCGEIYKLKASDAKERQFWVNRLRATAEFHSEAATGVSLPIVVPSYLSSHPGTPEIQVPVSLTSSDQDPLKDNSVSGQNENVSPAESLTSVKQSLDEVLQCQKQLIQAIESLPADGPCLRCFDSALLMLKATSQATIQCLEHCYIILHRQQTAAYFPCGLPPGAVIEWVDKFKPHSLGIPPKRNPDALSKPS